MAAILGIELPTEVLSPRNEKTQKKTPGLIAIEESEIDSFREAQGLLYFFAAPELFTPRVCKLCELPFLVSRKQVAYCSYVCLKKDLYDRLGVNWSRATDMELMVKQVYEGNEPLWVRNLNRVQEMLDRAKILSDA